MRQMCFAQWTLLAAEMSTWRTQCWLLHSAENPKPQANRRALMGQCIMRPEGRARVQLLPRCVQSCTWLWKP